MREPFAKFIESELSPDALLITCGLPASFKTETAEEVTKIKGYSMIRTDIVRLEVLKGEDIFDEKVASDMEKREKVYNEVFRRAGETLAKGQGVILDATFIKQSLRRRAAEIAAMNNRLFVIMQTSSPEEISLARIKKRTRENYESNALTEQAYMNNKAKFEEVDLSELKEQYPNLDILHFVVDTQYDQPEYWHVIEVNRG
ncbi:MAG: AAA family ATPase [Dehalococcoidia bacterium]